MVMEITRQHVESVIENYIDTYISGNAAARYIRHQLETVGVGLRPLIDHMTFRTLDVLERALEFEALGFAYDDRIGVVERDSFWYKVYRRPGFPTVLVQQAHADHRGGPSPIRDWVERFTDGQPQHIAILVDKLEHAVKALSAGGVQFLSGQAPHPNDQYRQIYTVPEMVDGAPFTVLELVERRWGFAGF